MAVEKVFVDDLTGERIPKGELLVIRIGLPSDRPEDCERIDLGPGSFGRPVSELVTLFNEMRKESLSDGYEQTA